MPKGTLESLVLVTRAVYAVTHSYGAPQNRSYVQAVVSGVGISGPVMYHVAGIPLGNFFAYSGQALDNAEHMVWDEIMTRLEGAVVEPFDLPIQTTLGAHAVYVRFAEPPEGGAS